MVVGQQHNSLTHVLLHKEARGWTATQGACEQAMKVQKNKIEVTVILQPNIKSDLSSPLFIESKSLGPKHTQGEDFYKGTNIKMQELFEDNCRATYRNITTGNEMK